MKKDFPGHGELDQAGLEALSIPELVKLYNEANKDKPVKLFSKKPVAVERVWASYPDPVSATTPAEAPAAGEEQVGENTETTQENQEDDMAKKNAAKNGKKAATGAKKGGGRKASFDPDARINILVKENPKRKGSASAKRFDKYAQNMKVADALDKGVKSADIAWDVKHAFIALK